MKKKIIITGGLGYIGTEVCRLYSGVSWNNQIIVIDIMLTVGQLRSNSSTYYPSKKLCRPSRARSFHHNAYSQNLSSPPPVW